MREASANESLRDVLQIGGSKQDQCKMCWLNSPVYGRSSVSDLPRSPLKMLFATHPIPGQQLVDPVNRVICNARQYIGQIRFGIEPIEFSRADETVDCCRPLASRV